MSTWTVEQGTLWALETGNELPPPCSARVEVEFAEIREHDFAELAAAMNISDSELIRQRRRSKRRCFGLRVNRELVTYGWVTQGVECVGELEREFHLDDDEAYIWDCVTVPTWRGKRLYSALLSHLIYRLRDEGIPRIWIGASRQNEPSIKGFVNAGFQPVIDCIYGRFYLLTLMWIKHLPGADGLLIRAAYRLLHNDHERKFGQLMIGFKT